MSPNKRDRQRKYRRAWRPLLHQPFLHLLVEATDEVTDIVADETAEIISGIADSVVEVLVSDTTKKGNNAKTKSNSEVGSVNGDAYR